MLAVVTILVRTQKKALKDWHLPIEPNSLVSICVTVGKSALLLPIASCIGQAKWIQFRQGFNPLIKLQEYDEAGRGPWGSLQLLFSIRKSDWIASLGAASTIISMALDPFAQQIIAYRVRQVDVGTAYLAAAQILDNVTDVTMQGAVLNGIYLSITAPSTYTCTSPVCRWPHPIFSLGMCSICRNVTSIVNTTCDSGSGTLTPTAKETWTFKSANCSHSVNENITLDTYLQTITFPATKSRSTEHDSQWTQTRIVAPLPEEGLGSIIHRDMDYLATALSYSSFFDKYQKGRQDVTPEVLAPEIMICGLYWCGKVYQNVSIVNGSVESFGPITTSFLKINYYENGETVHVQTGNGRCLVLTVPEANAHEFPNETFLFAVSTPIEARLGYFFRTLFNITNLGGNGGFSVFPEEDFGLYGLSEAIFRERDLALTFDRIASSVTDQIRTSGSSFRAPGLAMHNETYVQVRWQWIVLPLGVLILSIFHLIMTIWINETEGAPLWKESSVALLFHGLEGWHISSLEKEDVKHMNRAAERIKSKLDKGEGSWWNFSISRQ